MGRMGSVAVGLLTLAIVVSIGLAVEVSAGTGGIFVSTTVDELNSDGDCSLREAIAAVNAEAPVDACPGSPDSNNVFLEPGTYALSIPGAEEDGGATGDLDVLRAVSIDVNPATRGEAIVDGGGLDRILDIHPSTMPFGATITSVVLRNGDAGSGDGGAVRVSDVICDGSPGSYRDLRLSGVVLEGNRAARGGAIHIGSCNLVEVLFSSIVSNTAIGVGGGVSIVGDSVLSIDLSTISTNDAGDAGGGVWSDMSEANWGVRFSTVAQNSAAVGGGVWSRTERFAARSVLALNDGGNCGGPGIAAGFNVSDDSTCGGEAVDDAGLLPLAIVNGIPVHPLDADSPAVDAGGVPITPWCGDIGPTDQVGNPRPVDGNGDGVAECDAGAFEAAPVQQVPSPGGLPDTSLSAGGQAGSATAGLLGVTALACAASAWRHRRTAGTRISV